METLSNAAGQKMDNSIVTELTEVYTELITLKTIISSIITDGEVSSVFQPVVDLSRGEVIGWEILSRGPERSELYNPERLFSAARRGGLLYPLERLCREKGLVRAKELGLKGNLFINVSPQIIDDPHFINGETVKIINSLGLTQSNIVMEITEKTLINDYYLFNKTLNHYRRQGYKIAIDDLGAGYMGLRSAMEIMPEYVKIDRSLIMDIDKSSVKQTFLKTLVKLFRSMDTKIIVEGIEMEEELKVIMSLKADYGQGYIFGKPSPIPDATSEGIKEILKNKKSIYLAEPFDEKNTASSLMKDMPLLTSESTVSNLIEIFDSNGHRIKGLPVVDNGKPVGLVMKDKFYQSMIKPYRIDLLAKKSVALVMNPSPLIVNLNERLEDVSKKALTRHFSDIYDCIIVAESEIYKGLIAVHDLLERITDLKIKHAKQLNPLTGLPGNLIIEKEIERRIARGDAYAVCYADLDNFKAYNDCYGFEKGDRVIKLTADILSNAVSGVHDGFLGHIGGDDFIFISSPATVDSICNEVIKIFDKEVPEFYSDMDRERGYIDSCDRQGNKRRVPLMSISIGVVTNERRGFSSCHEISEVAAEVKKKAKEIAGSCYFIDRRSSSPDLEKYRRIQI